MRGRYSEQVDGAPYEVESLTIVEVNREDRIVAALTFDEDDSSAEVAAGNVDGTPATRAFDVETPLTEDLATVDAAAKLYFPDTVDMDVPSSCGGNPAIDCPGGNPEPPAKQLRVSSTRAIQTVLREVEQEDLRLALKGVSDSVRDLIFRNMSERAAETLREDIEVMGPVRLRDVEASQKKIVSIIRRLEEAGEIVTRTEGRDEIIE